MNENKPINYNDILEDLIKKDEVIGNLMKINFHKIGENNYKKVGLLKVYPLINKIILDLKKNLVIITPAKKDVAYLSSIFVTLSNFKHNFTNRINNFSNWLIEGNNVELCSAGDETGKIYKYLGKSKQYPGCISLESIMPHNKFTFHHKIETLLQLCPTTKNTPPGKKGYIPKPELAPIDRLLNVKSYGNSILYENKIIVLTDFLKSYAEFLNKETLMNKEDPLYDKFLNDIIKNGQIDEDGSIRDELIEPLLLYTRDLNSLYQYSSKAKNKKIVICDDIKKLNNNIPIVNQIKENGDKFRFLVFAGESEFDHINSFHKSNGADIWKFSEKEIEAHIKNVPHDDFNLNTIASGRALLRNKIHCKKKRIPIICEENILNRIHSQFDKIRKILFAKDEDIRNIIKEMIFPLYIRMFVLRDHMFSFPEDLVIQFEKEKKDFNTEMVSRKTTLDNEIWDHLVGLRNLFEQIPKYGEGIFDERLNELKQNLELREKDSKGNYAVFVYKIKTKNYFLKKIKETWNIDAEIICSEDTPRTFKSLIVPSELPITKMEKLLLNNNFENMYLLGSKSFTEKINTTREKSANRWQKLHLSAEKKCEYIGLDNNLSHIFRLLESNVPNISKIPSQPTIDLEKFFYDDKSLFFDKNISSENEPMVPAFQVVFNGDAYAYLTENFNTEVLNNIFDPSAFEKKSTPITKDWQGLKREDIIMIRDSVDKDVLDRESILVMGNEKEYFKIKKKINQISETISNAFGKNFKKDDIKVVFKNVGYDKLLGNVVSIANPHEGTICPNDFGDLEKIFKACAIANSKNFTYEKAWAENIFKNARLYKNLRIKAGRSLSQKLRQSIKLKKDLDYDGNPLRVDYINSELVLGSSESENPEAWIVQINNFEEPKKLKEVPISKTNKVII
jgi:hypothetical protein